MTSPPIAPPKAQEPPAEPAPAALSSIYLRLEIPEGIAVRGSLERDLTGEFTLGNSPDCDVMLEDAAANWRLRVALKDGVLWCVPVSGPVAVNGEPLEAQRRLRGGDTVSCGETAFRLKF